MDELTRRIAEFAAALTYRDIPRRVTAAAKVRLVDTIGCAIGGRDSEAARIGLSLAAGAVPDRWPGRVVGSSLRTTAETATFVNSTMSRYLDFNDAGPGSHPSDCIGALLAVAEAAGANGSRLVSAVVVAYEVLIRLAFGTRFRQRGFDQGFVCAVGTAAGAGHLLGLSVQAIAHAVSIAAVANVPLRASRAGQLSYWKGAATPFAVKNALVAALLAAEGMTGPEKPFEGRFGLWEQITGPFEIEPFPEGENGYMLLRWSRLKYWPVEYNTQIAVWAARALREKVPAQAIESVTISTYHQAWHETGSEPAKWDPRTRETADHSMPYIFARALLDGAISVSSFEESAFMDPAARLLMGKIKVQSDEEFTKLFPATVPIRVDAVDINGKAHRIELQNPLGHNENPMSDADVIEKFTGLVAPALGTDRTAQAAQAWRSIDTAPSLTPALTMVEIARAP